MSHMLIIFSTTAHYFPPNFLKQFPKEIMLHNLFHHGNHGEKISAGNHCMAHKQKPAYDHLSRLKTDYGNTFLRSNSINMQTMHLFS